MATATDTAKNGAKDAKLNTFRGGPDERGHFGIFGGRFVAETLMPLILDLEKAYAQAKADPKFHAELAHLNKHYSGRPSPLYFAERLTEHFREKAGGKGGAKVYFKRDELNHTGSHKINNCLGQILLAMRMGKTRIIAETGAGQHGVAVATVCARFGLPCEIFMGATDVQRQKPNVARMHTSVPRAGARLPVDHRQGGAGADAGSRRSPARYARRLHRRRLQRHRLVPPIPRR
jgi:tryptophan synthase beta chain